MLYYVIVADWSVDYESDHRVYGVYTEEERAIKKLKELVDKTYRLIAAENNYDVFVDTDECFDAGFKGFYNQNHTYVGIECVNMKEEDA